MHGDPLISNVEHKVLDKVVAMSPAMCAVACPPWHVCSDYQLCYAGLLVGLSAPAGCILSSVLVQIRTVLFK